MPPEESITHRVSAELLAAIAQARANPLGRRLFDDHQRFVAVLDQDGVIVLLNALATDAARRTGEEAVGMLLWEVAGFRDRPGAASLWTARLEAAAAADGPLDLEDVVDFAEGPGVVESEFSALRGADGTLLGFVLLATDVDDARRARKRLEEQERLREVVFDRAHTSMTILSPDGTVRDVNEAASRLGIPRKDAIGRRLSDIVRDQPGGGEARARVWQERLDAAGERTEPLRVIDVHHDPSTGATTALESSFVPVRDSRGRLELMLLEVRDRTEEYRFEQRLREGEEQFRAMAEAVPHMTWSARLGPDGNTYDYFSPRWATFTGMTMEELLQRGVFEQVHPDDQGIASTPNEAPDGSIEPMVFRMRRHDGEYRWMEARMAKVDDGGRNSRFFGATLDITERIEGEHEDRRRQEQLRATLQLTGFGTYVWMVPEDRFSRDSQLEEILGVPMEGMMTGNAYEQFFSIVHAEDREAAQQSVLGSLVPGGPDYDAEFRIIRPADGGSEERWVSAMGRTEFDERGEPIRLIGIFADITDKRLEEEARLRLQKMEAIGTLASGIAHDFNNVIGAILSYARVAEAELKAGVSPATSIGEIARGALRAGDVVKRLLTFSRQDEPRRVPFDLAAVAEEARTLVQPALPSGVHILARFGADLPEAIGDPTQLHQVVLNLLTNAGQAIGERGGEIELVVDRTNVERRSVGLTTLDPGEYLCLSVADDGPGMNESIARRIFDPFFTTKTASEGTGLGLAAVQSIVQNHGGSIAVETQPGHGAKFTIHLPAAQPREIAEVAPEPVGPPVVTTDAVRVLFVDDEQALVRLAYRAMPYHGCEVSGFTDPREALDAFEQDPDAFDALITDYSMPGLTGLDLTDRVRAVRSDLPIVLTSGYMGGESHAEAIRRGVGAVVPKPCSIDALADEVFRLLGRTTPADA